MLEKRCDLLFTMEALNDIAEIEAYIRMSFGQDPLTTFKDKWEKQQDYISSNPLGAACTEHEYRGLNIHLKAFKPSLIFYIYEESVNTVVILRVLREECDWNNIIADTDDYSI